MPDPKNKSTILEQLKKKTNYKIVTPTLSRRGIVNDKQTVARELKKSVSLIRSILSEKKESL